MVTLGNDQGPDNWVDTFKRPFYKNRLVDCVAGTFMHELGHSLGLGHGGVDDLNGKPNYFSVMNYIWQMPREPNPKNPNSMDYTNAWGLGYSTQAFNVLDEAGGLDESSGIGGRPGAKLPLGFDARLVSESGPVDFDGDFRQNNVYESGVEADINGDLETSYLVPYEDWSRLSYSGYGWNMEADPLYRSAGATLGCLDREVAVADSVTIVKGTATLNGYVVPTIGEKLTVEVWKDGAVLEKLTCSLESADTFAIAPESSGQVMLKFKLLSGLTKAVPITLQPGVIEGISVAMDNGDVDRDDSVTLFDYLLLSDAFDSSVGDANWDVRADLDGDGTISLFDYLILSENFDKQGDD